jgi:hypothetical protein
VRILTNHVWGDDCDDAVPEPVGGGREGNTTGSDGEREDFADENPGTCSIKVSSGYLILKVCAGN